MPKVAAVVDTNAMVDLVSCHDVIAALKRSEHHAFFRFERATYALRMAIHFHEAHAVTFSAGAEALYLTVQRAPPDVNDVRSWYVRTWFQFVQPRLLPQWTIRSAAISGKGNDVDDALVELARQLGCLLISNEGVGPDGPTGRHGVRPKAAKAGVRVMTTEEFCRTARLSRTRMKRYLSSFRTLGPRFSRGHRLYNDVQRFLSNLFDYHQKLLYGTEAEAIAERRERRTANSGLNG